MAKVFRKIRYQLLGGSNTVKYLKYAIGEILLVVIGILIAVQINIWRTEKQLSKEETKIYKNIKQQLQDDKVELEQVRGMNDYFYNVYDYANNIIERKDYGQQDGLARAISALAIDINFHKTANIYETLLVSGDIKLLNNDTIPSQLQKLEMIYNSTNRLEEKHWETITTNFGAEMRGLINISTFEPVKPKELYKVEMQNAVATAMFITKTKDSMYNVALKKIDDVVGLIERELERKQAE
ncbi:MAG: DUF6090 family protein [Bacteroidota bacterium]